MKKKQFLLIFLIFIGLNNSKAIISLLANAYLMEKVSKSIDNTGKNKRILIIKKKQKVLNPLTEEKINETAQEKNEIKIKIYCQGVNNPLNNLINSSDGKGILLINEKSKDSTIILEYIWSHALSEKERTLYSKDLFEKIKQIENSYKKNNVVVEFILYGQSHGGNLFILMDLVNKYQSYENRIKSKIALYTFATPIQKKTEDIISKQSLFDKIYHFYLEDDIAIKLDSFFGKMSQKELLWILSCGKKGKSKSSTNFNHSYEYLRQYKISKKDFPEISHKNILKLSKKLISEFCKNEKTEL